MFHQENIDFWKVKINVTLACKLRFGDIYIHNAAFSDSDCHHLPAVTSAAKQGIAVAATALVDMQFIKARRSPAGEN